MGILQGDTMISQTIFRYKILEKLGGGNHNKHKESQRVLLIGILSRNKTSGFRTTHMPPIAQLETS